MAIDFKDLPFSTRPDLSPYLLHLTKNTVRKDEYTAYENLVSILMTGQINGSSNSGFIQGTRKATCFMDVPFSSLKYILNAKDSNPQRPRYEPYGLAITKQYAYEKGCRPVMYLGNDEVKKLKIRDKDRWRVVRLEVSEQKWIS
jgi:hypothetical protein